MRIRRVIGKLLRPIRNRLANNRALSNFKYESKIKRNSQKIRVGFIVQYIPAWNKFKTLYDVLAADDRFEVFIICVPDRIVSNKLNNPNDQTNEIYDYYVNNGYTAINALVGKNKWFDLKSLDLDYIFYPRPYNAFMPKEYVSSKVSRYTKICCIMYGMAMTEEILSTSLNIDFFRNVYCYFAESDSSAKQNIANLKLGHELGYQKTVSLGMPVFAEILKQKDTPTDIWDFSKERFKAIWTPRWTTDLNLGGSNFFTYKDDLIAFAKSEDDIGFVFRPHPLSFDNFIKNNEMTQAEVDDFKRTCDETENLFLDESKEYVSTFWGSDVLITDISGILPEYFVTGKPIIYCATNMILTPAEHTKRILEGCYIANSFSDIENYIKQLKSGNDPMKEVREKIVRDLWGDDLINCVDMFVDVLVLNVGRKI